MVLKINSSVILAQIGYRNRRFFGKILEKVLKVWNEIDSGV